MRRAGSPSFVRLVHARRRAAAKPLHRLALVLTSFFLSAVTVVPWVTPESEALPPASAGEGTAIWRRNGSTSPLYREWNGASFDGSQSAGPLGQWRVMQGAASATRNEVIVAGVKTDGWVSGGRWDGSAWAALPFTLSQVADSTWWSVEVDYESQSGDALLVWANGTTGSTPLSYRVWNGSAWSAAATITTPQAGEARHLRLAASPKSDEMVLVASNSNSNLYALVWNGSAWGNAVTLDSTVISNRTDIGVAYMQQSGSAMVVYGMNTRAAWRRIWDGSSWGSGLGISPGPVTGNVRWLTLASDPGSDALALGVLTVDNEAWFAYYDGAAWGTMVVATSNATGSTFPAMAVAFEDLSGEAVAAYAEDQTRYRTWTSGSGWSGEQDGPDLGARPNSMTLEGRRGSNQVMLTVQDDQSDLHYAFWNGSSWGTPTEVDTDTGEVKNQPFAFLWDTGSGVTLSGTIYEDVNGDASLADGVGVAGVSVHLYRDNAPTNIPGAEDTLYRTATTGPGGAYSFSGVPDGNFWVAVDSTTITPSAGLKSGHVVAETWAEQTWAPRGGVRYRDSAWWFHPNPAELYGGMRWMTSDASTSMATREHIARMEIIGGAAAPGLSLTGLDFGFSFNVITRTGDGDDRSDARSIQGSLRQAIQNGNALQGTQSPLFRMSDRDTGYSGGVWTTNLVATLLDPVTDPLVLDATTQTGYGGTPVVQINGAAVSDVDPNCFTVQASNSSLRGLVINRCPDDGIELDTGTGNVVEANFIGTDPGGTIARPNGYGISVKSGNNRIGGPAAAQGNLIAGNTGWGIALYTGAAGNVVQGNRIGDGAVGNGGNGVEIYGGAAANTIGGRAAGEGNTIGNNGGAGVFLGADAGSGNTVAGNSSRSNGGLGIDLAPAGVTPNDAGDGDTGPNGLQNFPLVTSAVLRGAEIIVSGTLSSTANATFEIDLYASLTGDPTGYGEGVTYLGRTTVTTNGSGTGSFSARLPSGGTTSGQVVTATATTAAGSTSEFGATAAAVEFEGMILWRASGDTSPNYRIWDGTAFGPAGSSSAVGELSSLRAAESPTRDEIIVIGRTGGGSIVGEIWDGASWSGLPGNPLGSQFIASQWVTDVAYESLSGDGLLVWGDGTGLKFNTWNGSSWSASAAVSDYATISGGTTAARVGLASNPNSNAAVLAVTDNVGHDYVFVWNGSSWGSGLRVSTNATGRNTASDVAYQMQSGRAMVVYEDSGTPVYYRTWDGSSWSAASSFAAPGGVSTLPNFLSLVSDPTSNRLALAVSNSGLPGSTAYWLNAWTGSAWGTSVLATATGIDQLMPGIDVAFEGSSGQAIAAYGVTGSAVLRYRTWDSGAGWSAEQNGPALGAAPRLVTLAGDPHSDRVMLAEQNGNSDLYAAQWSGSAWGTATVIETSTGETNNQPFGFVWDRRSAAPVPHPPAFNQDLGDRSDAEGALVSLPSPATDPDGDPLAYSATGLPPGLNIDPSTGLISGTINYDASPGSPYSVVVRVQDPGGLFDTDSFTWTVTDTNQPPAFNQDLGDRSDLEGTVISLPAPATDPDGDPLAYYASELPPGLSIDLNTGLISGTIAAGASVGSPYTVKLAVDDTAGHTAYDYFTWTVSGPLVGPAVLKAVQSGTATLGVGTTAVTVPIAPVDPGRSFVVLGLEEDQGRPADGAVSGRLVGTDSLSFERAEGGGTVTIRWQVVEFLSGVRVQRGTTGLAMATVTVPITAVNPAQSFTLTTSRCSGDYWADSDFVRARLTSTSELELAVTVIDSSPTVEWQVVEYAEAVVQRGLVTLSPGSGSATVPVISVDPGRAWLITSYMAMRSGDPPIGERLVRGRVASATEIVFDRALTTGSVNIAWALVEFPKTVEVRSGSEHFALGEAQRDVTIVPVDPARSMAAAGYQQSGGSSPYALDDVPGVAFFAPQLVGPNTLRLRRGSTVDSADVGWFVVYWKGDHAPVFNQNLGNRSDAEGSVISLPSPATDLDGDPLAYSAAGLPPGLDIDPDTGLITGALSYTAASGSPYGVTVRVEDPGGLFDTDSFTWSVTETATTLGVTKVSDAGGTVAPGQVVEYTILVEVPGGSHQTGISVADPLPAGATYVPGSTVVEAPAVARDEFRTISYAGVDGALLWAGPWVEIDGGGPAEGADRVVSSSYCPASPCFRLGGDEVSLANQGIDRAVDLSGRTSATLQLLRRRQLLDDPGGTILVQVRRGTNPWTTLESFSLNGTDPAPVLESYDISAFIGPATTVRITGTGEAGGYFYADDVAIVADGVVVSAGGAPPALASGYHLEPGETLTVRFQVTVNDPPGVAQIANTATVTSDQEAGGRQATVVDQVNRAPSFDQDLGNRADGEGTSVLLPTPATDPDGDPLAWSATGLPPGLAIDPATGLISGTIATGASTGSPYAVLVRVEDPYGLFDTDSFTWTVVPAELTVTKVSDALGRVVPGQVITYTITATNAGTAAHHDVRVEDAVPAGTAYVPGSATAVGGGIALYADAFGAMSYGGSNGWADWSGLPWQETSEPTNPSSGSIRIATDGSLPFGALRILSGTILRPVDLSGFPSAELRFRYRRQDVWAGRTLYVEASLAGTGGPWTTVGSIAGGANDAAYQDFSANVSAYAGPNTAIRLRHTGIGVDPYYFWIDDLRIVVPSFPGSPPGLVANGELLPGQTLTVSFQVRADDPLGESQITNAASVSSTRQVIPVTATVTDPTNRPPAFTTGLLDRTDAEGDAISLAPQATDPDGDPLLYSATGLPPGLAIDPATGLISGTITYDASPGSPYAVTVRVEDPDGLFDTDTFTWTVTNTNRPPTFDGDLVDRTDAEGQAVSLASPATDLDGDPLAWSATGLPPGLAIDPATGLISGTISFTASLGSPYAVLVRVEDPGGLFDTDAFTWTVTDTNRPPVLGGGLGNRTNAEGDAVSLPAPASDPDGDPLEWSATGLPPGLAIDPATGLISGTITYDAAPGSPYLVVVRVEDPGGLFDSDAFSWTVTDTNRPPAVTDPGAQGAGEGQAVSLAVMGSDPDGDGLTWSAAGLPPGLAIDPATGVISGTVDYGASAGSPYTVTVRATDDGTPALWDEVGFAWTVSDTNRAPVVTDPGDQWNAEGDPVSLAVAGSDPDGDTITWSAAGLPPGLSIDPDTGVISGSIGFDAAPGSPYGVTVTATDDGVPILSAGVSFLWTVGGTNRPPQVLHPGDQWDAEGDPASLAPVGSDPDGDTLTWSASGLPPGLAIDPATGVISGTLTYEASAGSPHAVTITVTDDGLPRLEDSITFNWTVADTNRPPQVTNPGAQGSGEGQVVSLAVLGLDPDGDGLAWSATGLPPGLAIDAGTGVISGTVGFDAEPGSPYAVVVRATDDGAPSLWDEVSFSWTVSDTNRAPQVTSPGSQASAEGETVTLAMAGSDPDGDTLTWSATGLPPSLSIDPATGAISGTVAYTASPGSPYGVTVTATDDGVPVLSSGVSFLWAVTESNRAPVLGGGLGNRTDAEGDAVSLPVPASDPDGDTLTWSATGLPAGLAIDPSSGLISGTVSYEAAPGSPYAVTVRVQDPGGLSDSETFSWAVTNTNRAPEVTDPGPQAAAEGQAVTRAMIGSDPDRDRLAWSASGLPPGLAIDPSSGVISGTISYDAAPASPYWVTVGAADDGIPTLSDEVSFAWVVANTNRPPLAQPPGDRTDAEGAEVTLVMAGSDPDGNTLTWSAQGLPPGLSLSPATGVISGTIGYEASVGSPYGVTVTATDDGSPVLSAAVSFRWTVTDTNRPPQVLHPGDRWDAEGDAVSVAPVASDPDGDTLTWSATGLPPGLAIAPATGLISGTLSYEASAGSPHAVTLTVTDSRFPNLSASATFRWTVADTNRPPLVTDPGPQQGAEGQTVLLVMVGSDPDGDTLTWSATGLPPGLALDPATGRISGTLSYEASAGSPHAVAVTATDDGAPSLSAGVAFLWAVADTNRPPQILDPGSPVSAEGAAVSLALTGFDPDGDSISWSAVGLPPGLSMDPATGTVTGTLGYDAAGTYPVTVTATDDGVPSLSSQVSLAWQVTGTNRAPEVADPGPQSSAEGDVIRLLMSGFDPDGDHLTWSAAGLPPGLQMDPATGEISGELGFSTAGVYQVTVTARDDGSPSLSRPVSFSWTVRDTNRAPVVVVPGDRTDPEGAAVTLPVVGSDPDGDRLTWSAVGLPPGLSIGPATGVISGVLDFGVAAGSPYRVTVAASDDGSPVLAAGGSFTWSIGDVDRAPVLGSLPDRAGEVGDAVAATLTATDADGDPLAWSASGLPPGVSLDASGRLGGTLGEAGAFTVTVTVRAGAASDSGSFTWVVTEPGAPEIEPVGNQSGQVGEDASLAVAATSPGGGPLAYFASGLPPGLAIDPATGVISGTPTTSGSFAVTLKVTNPAGKSASATFLWIVEDLTDLPPEAQDDAVVVGRDELGDDGVVVVPVLGNDSDPEGGALTLVAVEVPAVGSADAVEGTVVFRPPADWAGTVAFAYRVADPAGQEDQATVTITVQEGPGDVPVAAVLQWRPPAGSGVAVPSFGSSGTLLSTLVQSLHVLRVPLALLGGAVIWSLLLGGALNVGLAVRRGLPATLTRRGRLMAIVMAAQGAKVPAFRAAGGGEVVHQYLATDARIKSTGRRAQAAGRQWLEVLTDEGRAWVESVHLTEHLDRAFFAQDRAAWQLLERFVEALRVRAPLADLVSAHGLWVAYHGAPLHYSPDRVARLWDDGEMVTWKGRNPAYPDLRGTFDTAVAAGVVDAHDHPRMELVPDRPAVPSTVIPVEFTNLHFISIGADLIGPERLDQTAWLVHFSYEDGKPRIIGLCREG